MHGYKTLEAWKHAHRLALTVLEATDDVKQRAAWVVVDQMRRAAVSVEANVVEGFALGTVGLIRRHVRIAIGSAAETECLLRLADERRYLPQPVIKPLLQTVDATLALLTGLYRSPRLKRKRT